MARAEWSLVIDLAPRGIFNRPDHRRTPGFMGQAPVTIIARRAARAHFVRARRAHRTARARRALTVRRPSRTRPRDLANTAALTWRTGRLRAIPLDLIVGTVDPTLDFDAEFRPATDRVASRWESIVRAHHEGRVLPPIEVIERPDGYYVLDGRHRVSVARALDRHDIDAWPRPAGLVSRARPAKPSKMQDAAMPNPACRCARVRRSATSTPVRPVGSRGRGH
jgi:hypothetical protein